MANVSEKIKPFLDDLERRGERSSFKSSDWLEEGTTAFKFAQIHLTESEKETLSTMVYLAYSL